MKRRGEREEVRKEGSREMRWSDRRQRKQDGGASRRVGVCGGWRETHFVFCEEKSSYWLAFSIFNFFFLIFSIFKMMLCFSF